MGVDALLYHVNLPDACPQSQAVGSLLECFAGGSLCSVAEKNERENGGERKKASEKHQRSIKGASINLNPHYSGTQY